MSTEKSATNKSSMDRKLEEFQSDDKSNNNNRVRPSTKRPRAPIACFRCHHKKVRCDGARPNCTRCLSTGVLCAYPSSRRSRTTQPTNVDPFIDNLSHLEARILQIESDLASQRAMVHSILSSPGTNLSEEMNVDGKSVSSTTANELNSKMMKTEMEVQDSRSILAQLRLRGEQRILRGKRAAAAAAAAASSSKKTVHGNTKDEKTKQKQQSNTKFTNANRTKVTKLKQDKSALIAVDADYHAEENKEIHHPSSFFYQNMMFNNTHMDTCQPPSPNHGMDWTLFDQHDPKEQRHASLDHHRHDMLLNASDAVYDNCLGMANTNLLFSTTMSSDLMTKGTSVMMDPTPASTRSSSLATNLEFPVILQPSHSTNSTTSNITASSASCSSFNSCENIFNFNMEDVMLQTNTNETVDMDILCNNPPSVWYYN